MSRQVERRDEDRQALKENESFRNLAEKRIAKAELRDYQGLKRVVLEWDLSPEAIRDRMFNITIGKESAIIDYQQFLHYSRLI